ncbi:hypothetical protein Pssp01_64630 [Pseudomonas sp. NBRC 100443]|nr:hypothetical protein Pssp01_64630 [Pseudomonas sp. NBRC 100443]
MISFTGDCSSQGKICEFKREFSANVVFTFETYDQIAWGYMVK